ncbi:class I lanthipeptide [Niabella pedocola]|uniref:Class I lanthipeptide n=1 Tax=Niabella pedocola TaxID=1752077 RepID=A0ABS8PTN0_9BACT|nr:class I lanthipeptide [Niabella pedocola]MCD2424424.1 class I lanthipeptide [Niabella pedocola]
MKRKKLQLNKKIVANLSNLQKARIIGGEDTALTTSFFQCTGRGCCEETTPPETKAKSCGGSCAPAATCGDQPTCPLSCPPVICV